MEMFENAVSWLTGIIWGPWLIILFVGVGVYFTIGTGFLQFRKITYIFRQTLGQSLKKEHEIKGEGTLIPRQAVSTALSSTVGVGNMVGVSSALVLGGPGALFWMWAAALFGMMTKYAEIVLSIHYREKDSKGNFAGGPSMYMRKGLNSPILAVIFTIALAIFCIAGNMIQSNAISGAMKDMFGVPVWVVGVILIILVAAVTLGGIKRLGKVTEKLVPFMAVVYIVGGIIVILGNIQNIPATISTIFVSAFSPASVGGGITGFALMEVIRYGVARGLYSNEAGMGTAPIAHATAKTDHPARQGMWGIMEVFIDTFVIATITGLAILTSGVLETGESPAVLASLAFGSVIPFFKYVVAVSLILFAYSTIIAISYYGETITAFLAGEKWGNFYRYLFLPFTFIGAVGGLQFIWSISDLVMAFAVIPNLIALALLSPKVFRLTKEFHGDSLRSK